MDEIDDVAHSVSHDELLEITESSLFKLLNYDSLLCDLPSDIIIEEILSQVIFEMDEIDDVAHSVSHDELLEITESSLFKLLNFDSLLCDLPSDIIIEEILSQIAVEHGQSIRIFISREDEPALKVIVPQTVSVGDLKKAIARHFEIHQKRTGSKVPQTVSVGDLKKAIARHFEIHQKRTGSKVKISWKYIWKTYNLSFDGIILDSNANPIEDYGVTNKTTLTFKKRRKKIKNTIYS
ncbi:U11/U12 small nuclear ribonucleoprotein 25 kDa protein [Papilio machaon]|uniref:U11/U12 small nuclear ribonucleoprotein 25 kDa protein n=1 Tax=Papilio machaon TaxID=76193 RepID=A0A194QNN5_PAPMA|nr:U11/U12 small nuclear ribonucleoprotein 25 kDa protein [Papilio machaon]